MTIYAIFAGFLEEVCGRWIFALENRMVEGQVSDLCELELQKRGIQRNQCIRDLAVQGLFAKASDEHDDFCSRGHGPIFPRAESAPCRSG